MPTPLYHITHIDNLPSILRSHGLLANSRLREQRSQFRDISHGSIQDRRAITPVPCAAGGSLHDYVPLYFAPRSPMLYSIHKGNVTRYQEGQGAIVHLVTLAESIAESGLDFTFTDGHATMAYSDFYDDLAALDFVIDWEVMHSRYWRDTDDDLNRKCKRQAEFLVHGHLPWSLITEIGVLNRSVQAQVHQLLQQTGEVTSVKVYSDWYYQT